mmetsp:Transcript_96534/g.300625  ORF Transcript_96534/g.300625 Transcript_96534/m.300625 type:complete len:687 (-) Transcript_96534:47-2107(-)
MDSPELLVAIKTLQDRLIAFGRDQERLREANKYLEQRVGSLERRLAEQPSAPGAQVSQWMKSSFGYQPHEPKDHLSGQVKQVPPDSSPEAEEEEAEGLVTERDIVELEYGFGLTLWEGVAFVGLPELRARSSVALVVSLTLNIFVQGYICQMLLMEDSFAGQSRFQKLMKPLRQWRLSSAHDYNEVDSRGMSLARRVCEGDESLSLAINQANLLSEINDYLSLKPHDLKGQGMGSGVLLCSICIFLFTVVVLRELRGVATSTCSVFAVPRGDKTRLEGGALASLSTGRLALILFANLVRASIALVLLYAGVNWLSSTTSIEDLVLNAAALGFVMDLDEHLFETTVPASVFAFVQKLKPLKYRRPRWSADAVLALAAIAAVLACSSAFLLRPNVADMLEVKNILCGGELNVVTERNEVGYIVSKPTLAGKPPTTLSLHETAVQELVHTNVRERSDLQFSLRTPVDSFFTQYRLQSILDLATESYTECGDRKHSDALKNPHLFTAARYQANIHAGVSLRERAWRCGEHAASCQSSILLRLLCPVTCGCDGPTSGLLASKPSKGCPAKCADARRQLISKGPCNDMSANVTLGWTRYWMAFRNIALLWNPVSASKQAEYADFVDRKIDQGCANMERDLFMDIHYCDSRAKVFKVDGFSTIMSFCPLTCCSLFSDVECPHACRLANASGVR